MLCLQVGASNELPESEELDALYDRFLLRRRVEQVSQGGIADMLQGVTALSAQGLASSAVAGSIADVALSRQEFETVRYVA